MGPITGLDVVDNRIISTPAWNCRSVRSIVTILTELQPLGKHNRLKIKKMKAKPEDAVSTIPLHFPEYKQCQYDE
jgi:hypothetical protein